MVIRLLKKGDIPRLQEIHAQSGVPIPFPNIEKEFLPIPVVVDENNRVVAAVGSVPAAEIYFFLDHEWETPGMRLEALKQLHVAVQRQLSQLGIVEVHAFVPPTVPKSFGKKLVKLFGWFECNWPYFSRRTDHV